MSQRYYHVYHQLPGILVHIGSICAISASQALNIARTQYGIRFPVLHELDDRGRPKFYRDDE